MNLPKWWDEYEIKARYIPTFLSLIPIVHFLLLLMGETFWKSLIGNISWMLVITNIGLSLLLMIAFVQIQCGFAKHWIEEVVFGKGGEYFPTTDMLLYNEGLISLERKELIRKMINTKLGLSFSNKRVENINPKNARLQAREAVNSVRKSVGKGIMTFQYNIRYGFFRNFIGGVFWSSIGSIGCSFLYGVSHNWKAMSLFIVFCLIHITVFILKKEILKKIAFAYADSLFNEFLTPNKGNK